ncbi:MAG: hypothetical protein K9J42_07925 [Sulfuritalea sp.]|nr:hypothetical protein [Sulfuritalea sp.]
MRHLSLTVRLNFCLELLGGSPSRRQFCLVGLFAQRCLPLQSVGIFSSLLFLHRFSCSLTFRGQALFFVGFGGDATIYRSDSLPEPGFICALSALDPGFTHLMHFLSMLIPALLCPESPVSIFFRSIHYCFTGGQGQHRHVRTSAQYPVLVWLIR